ncbi:MAG TPA: DUF2092 domain-containing protein [Thermoanaerobaculia bacterium]|nr:DUF2092 domain-containing protein [Thermoanaerobaculia bacterium]
MPSRRITLAAFAALLFAVPWAGAAQEAGASAPAVEPGAVAALERMGTFRQTLKSFEIRAAAETDEVLVSGQKLQFESAVHLRARRPDRLWAEVSSDRKTREYFYDGKSFTIYGPRNKLYATFPAPPTLGEVAKAAEEKYGLAMPLADLFRWGSDPSPEKLQAAMYVGPAQIRDTPCDHLAFRQAGVDWQVWIQKGDSPLPRKLVITTMDDDARPQYAITYDWNLAPALNDKMFTFEPPEGASRIAIQEVTLESSGK